MILVTGGAGFIGSTFVLHWFQQERSPVVVLDKLTYAGSLNHLESLKANPLYTFIHGEIGNRHLVRELLNTYQPKSIIHCAAESHVDRSILSPEPFITTNIVGTFSLLEETLSYWKKLPTDLQQSFRFLSLSTDEVYGSLEPHALPANEKAPYAPNSPYAASKASADHLVRAYYQTYQLPTLITHSTNNFGPRQFPEKLIPLTILNALGEKPIPIYGDGLNIRDWIYVDDHCEALRCVLKQGLPGERYHISAGNEKTNLEVVLSLCKLLDELHPRTSPLSYANLICHVKDRPGHDRRYALDSQKIQQGLGWHAKGAFEENLRKTALWYLDYFNGMRSC